MQAGTQSSQAKAGAVRISDLYTYRVFFSVEDDEYVAVCAELPGLSVLEKDPAQALRDAREVAAVGIEMLAENGDPIPQPFATRSYSGVFKVRIPPEVHRRLTLEAAEQDISLNRLVSAKLAGEVAEPNVAYGHRPKERTGRGAAARRRASRTKPSK